MSNDNEKKPLTLSPRGKLELKQSVEAGQVRQSFPHGRSKVVTVERRKKRTYVPGQSADGTKGGPSVPDLSHPSLAGLTEEERHHRLAALQASIREEDARKVRAAEEAARKAELDAQRAAEEAERARVEAEQAAARAAEEAANPTPVQPEAPAVVEAPAAVAAEPAAADATPRPAAKAPESKPPVRSKAAEEDDERRKAGGAVKAGAKVAPKKPAVEPKRRGKLTITAALDDDGEARGRSVAALRRAAQKEKRKQQMMRQSQEKIVRDVIVPDAITVQELANRMAERAPNVIKVLMKMGVMATINQSIDADTAQLVAEEFGHQIKRVSESDIEVGLETGPDDPARMRPRAPVVTVMVTSTTARPRCSTPCGRPTWYPEKPAASPSTSAPIR